jgi:hypothetical protein
MAQAPLIKLAPQLDFMWDELQGPESRTMRMFEANPNMGPGQYASLFEKMYERAGGAGDEIAQKYAQDVYSAMQDPAKAEGLPPNAKFAYGYLTQKGLSPQQAAGITGRLMVESYPSMDPNARNTMGGGAGTLGVAQWRGPRLEALAKSAGVSMDDIRALPSSTPEGNYYSQTGSGGDKMANGLLNMMPGATPDQVQEQAQPQRGGGLKGFLTNPDFLDTLAIGLGGMTMNPNVGVIEAAQSRMKNRAASRQDAQIRNKTAEWLRANKREDLAGAVESGSIDGKTAVTLAYQEPKDSRTALQQNYEYAIAQGMTPEQARQWVSSGTTVNLPGAPTIGTIPQGYQAIQDPATGAYRFEPIPGGPAEAQAQATDAQKAEQQALGARAGGVVLEDITRIQKIAEESNLPIAGPVGSVLSRVPGTNAYDVSALTQTIRANIGFDRLQQMREASPTGGALGQVSNQEISTLQAVLGNLDQSQSQQQFEYNLRRLGEIYTDIMRKFSAYPNAAEFGIAPAAMLETSASGAPDFSKMTDAELEAYIAEQKQITNQLGGL